MPLMLPNWVGLFAIDSQNFSNRVNVVLLSLHGVGSSTKSVGLVCALLFTSALIALREPVLAASRDSRSQ